MQETEQMLQFLRKRLKAQGITQKDLAARLDVSEASIKRMFASPRVTLERLAEVTALAGMTIAELAQETALQSEKLPQLTEQQEREVVADLKLLLVAVCVLNHWTMEDIRTRFTLTEPEIILALTRLDRIGLIDLLPGNRIRLKVARDFRWLPNGPIQTFFRERAEHDYLSAPFPPGQYVFTQGMLTEAARQRVTKLLEKVRQEFSEQHRTSLQQPLDERHGTGLLLAMREWEPSAFSALRRRDA